MSNRRVTVFVLLVSYLNDARAGTGVTGQGSLE